MKWGEIPYSGLLTCILLTIAGLWLVACGASNPLAMPTDTPPPPTATPKPTATPLPAPGTVHGFETFLAEAKTLKPNQRQDLVNRYSAQLAGAPITEDIQAVFLWMGAANSVELIGDMNNWIPDEALPLVRLEGTDLWYLVSEFEPEARLDYRFMVDGTAWKLDPLNSETINSRSGPNSVLTMPAYEVPTELLLAGQEIPHGGLTNLTLDSESLNQTRTFFVYEPAGQLVGQKLPVIYINNGSDYLDLIEAPLILDNLIAQRIIPPLIAVFIPSINLQEDYVLNDDYSSFLADELSPFIQQTYDVATEPKATGIMGSALGGLAAVYTGISRPDVFGLVAGQSGLYETDGDLLFRQLESMRNGTANLEPIRFYLVAGSYETAVGGDRETGNVLAANQRLAESLTLLDHELRYDEQPEGHSWGLWEGTLGKALAYLFEQGS